MATVFHVWRSRMRNKQQVRELVNGADGKPITFPTAGEATAAAGVFNCTDPDDWTYFPSGPVTTES